MKSYAKLTIAASLILSSTNAFAGSVPALQPAPQPTASQTVPKPHTSSDVFLASPNYYVALEFSALFLKPMSSSLHYAAEALPLPAPTPNWKISEIHPDYHFAFDVGITGALHCTNTNVMLNWEHFHSRDSASKTVHTQNMVGPFFTIGPDASPYNEAHGHVHFRFEEINLDYGILVNFGDRAKTNLFAGVSYAYIKQTLTSKYSSPGDTYTRSIRTPSRFSGVGPQVGLNFSYRIVEGFHLAGNAMASLFVGSMKNHTIYESVSPLLGPLGITPPNRQKTKTARKTQVVPGLEGKLGLAYSYSFLKHYMVSIEAGYEAQIYFNAIQATDMGSEVPLNTVQAPTVGVYARTFQENLSNFALAGPYATVNLAF